MSIHQSVSQLNATSANNTRPLVLSIAGSDNCAIAGIQRDNHTIVQLGCHALNIITANTSQSPLGVLALNPTDCHIFQSQLDELLQREPQAIKIGLVANAGQFDQLSSALYKHTAPVVFDPVMSASSGSKFHSHEKTQEKTPETHQARTTIADAMRSFLQHCDVVTPNIDEAELLCEMEITSERDMQIAAEKLIKFGAKHVVLKGGHSLKKNEHATQVTGANDFYCNAVTQFWLCSDRQDTQNTRATGCAFSSSIATALAQGYCVEDAVVIAKMAINQALESGYALEQQAGPVLVNGFPEQQRYIPKLYPQLNPQSESSKTRSPFLPPDLPNGEAAPLGLYPVVDSVTWLERLLPLGVSTIQLRVKNLAGEKLRNAIRDAIAVAEHYQCRLFINDYWEHAIALGAYGVHLGQEDLDKADIHTIAKAGLRLGISTHSHAEVARALVHQPSYIAYGPVYATQSKSMPWIPQGETGFEYWRNVLNCPLVAIGGIDRERAQRIAALGADGIAMISAITAAQDWETTTQQLLKIFNAYHQSHLPKN